MSEGWEWDDTLFLGAAPYYQRGRLPYAPGLADTLAEALTLDGRGRLVDVGCGPGTLALGFAHLFGEIVGVDPDSGMTARPAGAPTPSGRPPSPHLDGRMGRTAPTTETRRSVAS
ncbi:hypothetical protein AB0B56_16520 [Streptosporangium canum]|uniref:hypothetical protein n=1 Tax=Streptosporangium canum TaxID=324952 RepID=UPI00342C79B6